MPKTKTSFKKGQKAAQKWTISSITPHVEKVYEKGTETAAGHALNLIEKQLSKSVSKKIHLEFLD